jgi:hypothetical protein
LNLYFKSSSFKSNRDLAGFVFDKLKEYGLNPAEPKNEEFMYVIETTIDEARVIFYLGKNDEESEPALWQIWPEQSIPFFKRIFGKVSRAPEQKAKSYLEEIIHNIQGVSAVEWGI